MFIQTLQKSDTGENDKIKRDVYINAIAINRVLEGVLALSFSNAPCLNERENWKLVRANSKN